jgi:hypothetical protein
MTTERQEKRPTVVKVCSVCGTFYDKGGVCNKCNLPQQPQREYIITEEQLDILAHEMAAYKVISAKKAVLARPHPPAPDDPPGVIRLPFAIADEDIYSFNDWEKKQRAAIERAATLAAYDKFLDEMRKEDFDNLGYIDMDSIEAIYVRLRTQSTTAQQESNNSSSKGGIRR